MKMSRVSEHSLKMHRSTYKNGFTVVELLIVIIVIAVLATLVGLSYIGISKSATIASLTSDLKRAAGEIELYHLDHHVYPSSITDCPNPASTNICVNPSSGNVFTNYSNYSSTSSQTYTLTATNNDISYVISKDSAPTSLAYASAASNPVADWLAMPFGDHYGTFLDLVSGNKATVSRSTLKTIYDSLNKKIYDVPANKLAIGPRSDGKSGSEAVIEEARTNYVLNSYFSTDSNSDGVSDNWTSNNNNSTSINSRNTTNPIYGTVQKTRVTHNIGGATGYPCLTAASSPVGSFVTGETATASIWYRNMTYTGPVPALNFRGQNADTSAYYNQVSSTLVANDPNWRRATVSVTFTDASNSRASLRIQQTQNADGQYFEVEVAAAQIEKGGFVTSYIPTTTSISNRDADIVTVPTSGWGTTGGSYAAVAGPNVPTGPIFEESIDGNNKVAMFRGAAINMAVKSAGVWSSTNNVVTNAQHTYVGTWSNGTKNIGYSDGVGVQSSTNSATPVGTMPSTARVGSDSGGSFWNGALQRFIVYNSVLSGGDVITITSNIADGPQL